MAFINDSQYLIWKLRESLLLIQDDLSHDIGIIRNHQRKQSLTINLALGLPTSPPVEAQITPILKVKDSGMRENLYKVSEPLFQTLYLSKSGNLGSKHLKGQTSQSSLSRGRRKSGPPHGSAFNLEPSNNASLSEQLSSSLSKIEIKLKGPESYSRHFDLEKEVLEPAAKAKKEDGSSIMKSTLQDDDLDELADFGDDFVYELPANFTGAVGSADSRSSGLLTAKRINSRKRSLKPGLKKKEPAETDKDKPNTSGVTSNKHVFDAAKFGADPQEPVILELQRFLDSDSAESKHPAAAGANKDMAKMKEVEEKMKGIEAKMKEVDGSALSRNNSSDELNEASVLVPVQEPYKFDKLTAEHLETTSKKTKPKSTLTTLMERKAELNNPLAAQYSAYGSKVDPNGMKIKMYLPFSESPEKPLFVSVKADASVDNVIGYCLFEYINEKFLPLLSPAMLNVSFWSIRIVEDDGEIDEDFPALERSRKIGKYAFDQFALINLKPLQEPSALHNSNLRANLAEPSDLASTTPSVFLKVHLYSTLEIKQTTIMQMPLNISMLEVFNRICAKRGYDQKDFILKMADVKTDVPLDKTLQQVDCIEFCVLKRSSGGAGDIFLRPQDEVEVKEDKIDYSSEDFRTMFKQYTVVSNKLMGRQERVLTIDGEYTHLDGAERKGMFDRGKSAVSYHMKDVLSCVQPKAVSGIFRLTVQRADGNKIYEFEAGTPRQAYEICSRFAYILDMRTKSFDV